MMRVFPLATLTRLIFVVHEDDYEFQRNLNTGVITGGKMIDRDAREWALVISTTRVGRCIVVTA